jgi:hypothetical protein
MAVAQVDENAVNDASNSPSPAPGAAQSSWEWSRLGIGSRNNSRSGAAICKCLTDIERTVPLYSQISSALG